MGNQQERRETMRSEDLFWLGGVWDGEGSVCIVANRYTNQQPKKPTLNPHMRFTNTCQAMIDEVRRILDEAEVPYHVQHRPPTKGTKSVFHISMSGMKRAKVFLDKIGPYLRAKQPQVQIVKSFIESRLATPPGTPYTEQELAWYVELRKIHGYQTRESSEAICQAIRAGRG